MSNDKYNETDIEYIEVDDEDIEYIVMIEGVLHKWDFKLKEYRPVDSRRLNYDKKDYLQ